MYSASTQVVADDRTIQCEHINRELWLYIVSGLLVQSELELNNKIYKMGQCTPRGYPQPLLNVNKPVH